MILTYGEGYLAGIRVGVIWKLFDAEATAVPYVAWADGGELRDSSGAIYRLGYTFCNPISWYTVKSHVKAISLSGLLTVA